MAKEKKARVIDELQEAFAKADIAVLTDYRGLHTPELINLRKRLKEAGAEYRVVKNTLARRAAEKADKSALTGALKGPMAIAFGHGDIAKSVKALTGYIQESKTTLTIKGGILGGRLLTAEEVQTLATLPPREILISRVLGQMKSPITGLVYCLNAPMRGVIGVLQARIKQLEVK